MKFSSETELITAFRNGDEDAIRQLHKTYYRSLCYFSDRLLDNKTEAEDIATDTFIKLLGKREDFDSMQQIKGFLFTATRNACIDELRKKKRRTASEVECNFLAEQFEELHDRELLTSKVLQLIYAEVEALPGQCKQVFKSVFVENKSTSIVAAEMSISPQTVLNQKTKALQRLRLTLQKEGLYSSGHVLYCFFLFCLLIHLHRVFNPASIAAHPPVISLRSISQEVV